MACNHDCASCGEDCKDRVPQDLHEQQNKFSNVKHVIGIVSGKGGVGKSLVTSMLAVTFNRMGKTAAILDADITGPSIPKAFGIHSRAKGNDDGILPTETGTGIRMMSINLLLDNETDPVVWRAPMITGTVKQFWTDVMWGDVDYMLVDMPPGTGDIPLTVFQSLPLDGIIVVASPQELVSMIVEKAVNMADLMKVPVLGVVENMAYFSCPDCGKKISVFGESHIDEVAAKHNTKVLARLPIDPELAKLVDKGMAEMFNAGYLDEAAEEIEKSLEKSESPRFFRVLPNLNIK